MSIPRIAAQHWTGTEFGVYANIFRRGEKFYEHRHEFNEFFLVAEGTVRQRKNGLEDLLGRRSLCFNRADDQHDLETPSAHDHVLLINCTFSDRVLAEVERFVTASGVAVPPAGWSRTLKNIPSDLWQTLHNQARRLLFERAGMSAPLQEALFKNLLAGVLTLLAEPEKGMTAGAPDWLVRLREKMQKEENFIAGLDRMIELSGRSQEHLTRNLSKYYGETPTEFINRLRVHRAAQQLLQADVDTMSVMFECGFNNYAWFLRCFRRSFGMSPQQYVRFNRQLFARRPRPGA